tara:strand:- start:1036 stop:1260 length:225 start_codon:yes stop_codon:yes gene_type:complete
LSWTGRLLQWSTSLLLAVLAVAAWVVEGQAATERRQALAFLWEPRTLLQLAQAGQAHLAGALMGPTGQIQFLRR